MPTPELVTCPKDEYEAMCAVMATLDPATVPGLTVAQRCALGAFAKSHKADDARSSEVRILRGYVKDLEDTLDKIAVSLGVEGRRPELLIFKCGQVAEALQASSEDAARWRWIHPFLELESDFLYESGTARYSLIHLKGDQVDLPPSLYYKDVVAGVDAARALARKQNG